MITKGEGTHIEWINGEEHPSPEPGAYLGFCANSISLYRFTGVWQGTDEDRHEWETMDGHPEWYAKIDAVPPDYILETHERRYKFLLSERGVRRAIEEDDASCDGLKYERRLIPIEGGRVGYKCRGHAIIGREETEWDCIQEAGG